MELENINKSYSRSKKALDKSGKLMTTVESLKTEVKNLKRQLENIQIEIIRAQEDGDSARVKTLEESKKAPKADLAAKKKQLEKLSAIVTQNETAISVQMTELSKDPALKAHLDEVISKKFSRKLSKIQKDKEERTNQNKTLLRIQEAAKTEPNVMYSLKEIEKYSALEAELQAIIADPAKSVAEKAQAQTDLLAAQNSLEKSRSDLARYFKGTISREVIDKITSYEDLERDIKSNNKYIKGLDKQIANYETALENIGFDMSSRAAELSDISDSSSSTTRTGARGTTASRTSTGRPASPTDLPAEQPKWYQFIRRFKNWNARRKAAQEPVQEPVTVSDTEKKKFKDSMKYDVVKDYEEKVAADLLKQAKAQNREAANRDRDE